MLSLVCETIGIVGMSVRDTARAALQKLGIPQIQRREGKGRANQLALNIEFTRDMPKSNERSVTEPELAKNVPVSDREPIREEPKPLQDFDLGRLRNFGE
jgi:hypothetical protein